MRLAVTLLTAALVTPALAANCPVLTCEQLKARVAQRCPPEAPCPTAEPVVAKTPAECPPPPVCPPPPPPVVNNVPYPVFTPVPPVGHALVGFGPIWFHDWGATVVGGYQFASGWQLQGGPVWIEQRDVNGTINPCDSKGLDAAAWCYQTPFHVEAKSPWGAQVLLIKTF